ncbi:TldD/PmbA family protein [Ramlibacter albus]|uniref:TldE/PmbA family protein n=1 Tax=Ramlibacter albus TaxID=2079448 RepID=A0A923M884_9BURK|nr:metallopeptidase TldD-related protein [Ramlibacter albus]MBC5766092.1 TldE/PmbA family protein [Ramlibacter albus]
MRAEDFDKLAAAVCQPPAGTDLVSLAYSAESTEFIRFNHAQVRQAMHVDQHYATLGVVAGTRRATSTVSLSGHFEDDARRLREECTVLARDLPFVPEDPHLLLPDKVESTHHTASGTLPSQREVVDAVARHAGAADLVGLYAGGPVTRAYADSRGQRNWHRVESFHFDWSLYLREDQAVKTPYAGTVWEEPAFASRVEQARERLVLLERPRKTLPPGEYRAFFTPGATADLLGILGWGGFSQRALRTGVSTLQKLHKGEALFSPQLTLTEAVADGVAPRFQMDGFVKPASVPLVAEGRAAGTLVSARSSREYGVAANGANAMEAPESLDVAPGKLPIADALKALDTGVYVSNVHYLNYSDRASCRITGMTRFACFWVEKGELVAPINVMRFDDSLLRMFGEGLIALTDQAELSPDPRTWGSRQLRGVTAPGALVDGFRLTL